VSDSGDGSDPTGESARFNALLKRAAHLPAMVGAGGTRVRVGALLCGERFQVLRRLGEGGMGMVFEAFDRTRGVSVALKTVSQLDAGAIYRLKNEFRSLAEVLHPNLVQLYELFADEGQWLFSMELVPGVPFDQWTRPNGALDLPRLRAALRQLVSGVRMIHAAGKLHRDLKPSNMLVTPEGRVVILDFGLAADPEPGGTGQTSDAGQTVGTPAYMAPEQAAALDSQSASDWYAVGVILFEALTGQLPFDGKPGAILVDKQLRVPPRASALDPRVPEDLDRLCSALLEREPGARPSGEQVEAMLAHSDAGAAREQPGPRSPRSLPAPLLVGRVHELDLLRAAYASSLAGRVTVAHVSGESGVGKSTLCAAFMHELREREPALVLSGRCYERESVPYKAFDRLVDELSRYLQQLSEVEAAGLMPRAIAALARVFPVLERVSCVATAPQLGSRDEHELRRLAFEAFAELLARIRDRRPLVLYLDDLQWTDHDSALLLERLLLSPACAPLLLVASHRGTASDENRSLARVLASLRAQAHVALFDLTIAPLPISSATQLAQNLLVDPVRAAEVAREAGGNPFFVGELCRYVIEATADGERPLVALEHALERRVARAGEAAARVLALLAISGRPTPAAVLAAACRRELDVHAELHVLRGAQLVRASGERGFECYHDRIRVALAERLPAAARAALHGELARAWEESGDADPEVLFEHCLQAGERERAAEHAAAAAHKAAGALAFERSAALYRQAIALCPRAEVAARGLEERLGDALSRAGRWADAGAAFARAALLDHERSLQLEHRAAVHFLGSGRYDQGMPRLRRSFALLGLHWPRSAPGALLGVVWQLVRLRFTGERVLRRPVAVDATGSPDSVAQAPASTEHEQLAMSVLLTGAGLVPHFDTLRGLYLVCAFVARGLRGRAAASDVALALGMLSTLMATWKPTREYGQRLATRALEQLPAFATPDIAASVIGCAGFARVLDYKLEEARELGALGSARLHGVSRTYVYQAWGARIVQCFALTMMGRLGEAAKLYAATELEARELGDELAAVGGSSVLRYLVEDDVAGAERLIAFKLEFLARVPSAGVLQRIVGIERATLALYSGRGEDALPLLPGLDAGGFGQLQPLALSAGCALQAIDQRGPDPELLKVVRRALRRTPRDGHDAILGLRAHLHATLVFLDGDRERARVTLERATDHYTRAGLALHAAGTRLRTGQLSGGPAGAELVVAAQAFMRAQGLVNVPAWTAFLVPGFAALDA
jgi:serine/threonine protein kinase/tetratricopeptide (TPR) repeat protein